jgi:hypothetical protein
MLAIQEYLISSVPILYYGITALGATFVFFRLFIFLRGFLRIFFRKKQNYIKVYGEKSWVLVTGSSQGTFELKKGLEKNSPCSSQHRD